MNYKKIGSRLLMAASFVENANTVCDVGCDHGKLSLYLIKENLAKKIIATDINQMPLQKAKDLFLKNDVIEKADFYLTDGLEGIKDISNITHIIIAGLGGHTMAHIIENAPFIKENKVELILLCAQSAFSIRHYLYKNGFEIIKEETVSENKKYYSCMKVVFNDVYTQDNIYNRFIGKSDKNTNKSAKGYFEMVKTQLTKKQKGSSETEKQEIENAIAKIEILINACN